MLPQSSVYFLLPRHSTWPSPSKPGLHLQTYSAGRLQHSALSTHFPASSGMAHSSISENKNLTLWYVTHNQWVGRSTWVILSDLNRRRPDFSPPVRNLISLIWNSGGHRRKYEIWRWERGGPALPDINVLHVQNRSNRQGLVVRVVARTTGLCFKYLARDKKQISDGVRI